MTSVDRVEVGAAIPRIRSVVDTGKETRQRQEVTAGGKAMPTISANSDQEHDGRSELSNAMASVADYVQNIARDINFRVDEDTDKFVVTVTDQQSGEVIRQIPNEEMLEISKNLADAQNRNLGKVLTGLLFRGDA